MRGKTATLVCAFTAISFFGSAQMSPLQVSKSNSFTTGVGDYNALDINPANVAALWREDKRNTSFGFIGTNVLLFSHQLKSDVWHDKNKTTWNDPAYLLDHVLIEKNGFNMTNSLFGINFHIRKAGSFAFSMKNNVYVEAEVNGILEEIDFENSDMDNFAEVLMHTIQENPELQGEKSYMKLNVTNDFNLGYSRKVVNEKKLKLFVGAGVKYILGFADMGLQFNGSEIAGYYSISSLIPEDWEDSNYVHQVKSNKKFGHGFGGSIGTTLKAGKFTAGVSVMDLGFMKWPSKSLYITNMDVLQMVLTQQTVESSLSKVFDDFQRNENGMELLPARVVIGGSYEAHKYVHFFMDMEAPLVESPRKMENPTIGAGTRLSLFNYVTLKTGATLVSKRMVTMPVYLSLFGGSNQRYEFSIGTSDCISIFKRSRPHLNADVAMWRFHF